MICLGCHLLHRQLNLSYKHFIKVARCHGFYISVRFLRLEIIPCEETVERVEIIRDITPCF